MARAAALTATATLAPTTALATVATLAATLAATAATLATATALLAPTTALVATAAAHGATAALATRRAGSQAIRGSANCMRNRHPEVAACGNTAESNHHQQECVLGEINARLLAPQTLEQQPHDRFSVSKASYLVQLHG
jgi:hypothetical protein